MWDTSYKGASTEGVLDDPLVRGVAGAGTAVKPSPLIMGLGLVALFFAVLLPPEAYPDGKVAVILCATFAFFASLAERRISGPYVVGGIVLFGLLLLHSALISVDPYRSIEFTSVLWAYYCLLGVFFYSVEQPLKPLAVCMVAACVIVSGYGLYQYFWGFDELYSYISNSASAEVVKAPALGRIATRRVFSTLSLPGTLWGFLVVALPLHGVLWRGRPWTKVVLAASAAMLFATGFLTRSFGFLLGLLVLSVAWLVLRNRRVVLNWLMPVLIVLVLAGGAFYSVRREVIAGSNPASLRFISWISAWTIFAANPLGTGLNTYGVVYSRYMLPGATESQYTHNTPLQLMSELGYPFVLTAAALFLIALRRRQKGQSANVSPYVVLAFTVWAVHNLVDINVYFPSLGVIGAILLGVLLRPESVARQPVSRLASVLVVSLGIGIVAFSGLAMVSSELQFRAQAEFGENKFETAAETLKLATSLMPLNSSLFHDAGDVNLNLHQRRRKDEYLEAATQSFRRAIALSPEKAGSHIGLALCFASVNRVDDALEEIGIARRLYPDSTYADAVARLLEKRRAGIAP